MVNNDWKCSSSFPPTISEQALVCPPVYSVPPGQGGIVLLLLYTMWVVKPENELTLCQQHLVLVHFLKIASNGEECVYQSLPSIAEELIVCLQRSVSFKQMYICKWRRTSFNSSCLNKSRLCCQFVLAVVLFSFVDVSLCNKTLHVHHPAVFPLFIKQEDQLSYLSCIYHLR